MPLEANRIVPSTTLVRLIRTGRNLLQKLNGQLGLCLKLELSQQQNTTVQTGSNMKREILKNPQKVAKKYK